MLPREHGSWALLIVPIAVGLLGAPIVSPVAAGLFVLGALAAFLLRTPLQALLARPGDRRALGWLAFYSLLTAGTFFPLIALLGCWKLLLFAAPLAALLAYNAAPNGSGRRLSALNEAAGVLGLCLGAPAAVYAASFELGPRAWSLWLLCSAFFLGPIFHVKMAALQHRAVGDPAALPRLERMRRLSAAYHGAALAAVGFWAASGGLPAAALIPFGAALAKTLARGFRAPERVDFRSLGYAEVAYSVLFVVVIGAAFVLNAA
ncbi:MAG: YwiC-like family protein [Elusimicrobia bacterium]|nr:YwiC-like family protein [Elusimicrobiota bacterium]